MPHWIFVNKASKHSETHHRFHDAQLATGFADAVKRRSNSDQIYSEVKNTYRSPSLLPLNPKGWPIALDIHDSRDPYHDMTYQEYNDYRLSANKDILFLPPTDKDADAAWEYLRACAYERYDRPDSHTFERRSKTKYWHGAKALTDAEKRKDIARDVALNELLAVIDAKNFAGLFDHHCREGGDEHTPWSARSGWVVGVTRTVTVTEGEGDTRKTFRLLQPQWFDVPAADTTFSPGAATASDELVFVRVGEAEDCWPLMWTAYNVRNSPTSSDVIIFNDMPAVTLHAPDNNAVMGAVAVVGATTQTTENGVVKATVAHDAETVQITASIRRATSRMLVLPGEWDGDANVLAFDRLDSTAIALPRPYKWMSNIYEPNRGWEEQNEAVTVTVTVVCQAQDRKTYTKQVVKITRPKSPPPPAEDEEE